MKEIKLSRTEVENSIRGSLAEELTDDKITFDVAQEDIIELTPDMEIKSCKNEFNSKGVSINPFDNYGKDDTVEDSISNIDSRENIDDIIEEKVQNWLNKNLSDIVQKAVKEEVGKIYNGKEENE